ncbi:MAG: 23S rRNA (guanosine(2251)-2'-O)-methyltransferase RlmB, partial [Alphaproteobacteria bacterium]|nr:23S rRNA (guanosine(2251)-2'-O)-methyltransferase RlmB [Alphaproteobacteria bacterium]
TSLPSEKNSQVWLYGTHPVTAALNNDQRHFEVLALTSNALEEMYDLIAKRDIPYMKVSRDDLSAHFGEDALHQGIAALVKRQPPVDIEDILENGKSDSVVLILDQVTDPHNVGAILRSAAIFGADAVILPDRNAPEESAVLAKTASGALEEVPLVYVGNLARAIEKLQEAGYWTVGFAGESDTELQEIALDGKIALVMGAEGPGMRRLTREKCDSIVRIPMADNNVGSLNVSNAAAVALYATHIKRK